MEFRLKRIEHTVNLHRVRFIKLAHQKDGPVVQGDSICGRAAEVSENESNFRCDMLQLIDPLY